MNDSFVRLLILLIIGFFALLFIRYFFGNTVELLFVILYWILSLYWDKLLDKIFKK